MTSTPPNVVGHERALDGSFEDVVARTTAALKGQGFGVLCDIDVQATLKEKLGLDKAPYRILGACNPPLADEALDLQPHLGVLLPCNVIVRQVDDQVIVSSIDAQQMLGILPKEARLDEIAGEVNQRLAAALDEI